MKQLIIAYSRGVNTFDNAPQQCVAASFDEFERIVLSERSSRKGLTYICSPLAFGEHYQKPLEYPGNKNWRLKNYVEPRAFLPFDFDGFASPAYFAAIKKYLARYRGFGYTTASHTDDAPRARAVLQASRPVSRSEGEAVCRALQAEILVHVGNDNIFFDESVYRGEQPIYTPVTTSIAFHFGGHVVDVDEVLERLPYAEAKPTQKSLTLNDGFPFPDIITDGEGREASILSYAGHLRNTGLDQTTIERILLDYNKVHISPQLDEAVVLDRARRYQPAVQGNAEENPFADIAECKAERFFGNEAPPQRWVIKDLLPAGVAGLIVAPGGTGKSWFLLQLSASVAAGIPLAGFWEVE